jgi:hypothetical protein
MLRTTACWKELPRESRNAVDKTVISQSLRLESKKIDRSLFLMDLVLPERDGATTDFQYRRWIQAGQDRLVAKEERNAIEHRQCTLLAVRMHAHRLVIIRRVQRGNLTSVPCSFFLS